MRLALSVGFPHYDFLLDKLNARQFIQLQLFFKDESADMPARIPGRPGQRISPAELRAREVACAEWFRAKIRLQNKKKHGA